MYFTQKALKRHVYKKARTSKHCVVVLIYAAAVYTFREPSETMGTLGIFPHLLVENTLDPIRNHGEWGRLCPMHSRIPNWFENIPPGLIHRYTAKKSTPVVQFYFYCNLCLETEKCFGVRKLDWFFLKLTYIEDVYNTCFDKCTKRS